MTKFQTFITPSELTIYDTSDNSGILVFVPKLGKVVSLDSEVGAVLVELSKKGPATKNSITTKLTCLDEQEIEKVWHSLIAEGLVLEVV
jgi:hypothetical protein